MDDFERQAKIVAEFWTIDKGPDWHEFDITYGLGQPYAYGWLNGEIVLNQEGRDRITAAYQGILTALRLPEGPYQTVRDLFNAIP